MSRPKQPKQSLKDRVLIRPATPDDIPAMVELSVMTYASEAWETAMLESHQRVFSEGQLVAIDQESDQLVGMACSLIVQWDDYDFTQSWNDFTDHGYFTNHDPKHGRTLYGADVEVNPECRGMGIGKTIYAARRELCRSLKLRRIRAGARIRHYHKYKEQMSPEEYVMRVINGEIGDPTLTFQIKQGFRVLGVVRDYLDHDPETHGHAALIEWINHEVARPADYRKRDPRFAKHRKKRGDNR